VKRITVYLTDRTFEQLVTLSGARVPQLITRTAQKLLSFAIRAMFRPGLTVTGRFVKKLVLENASPTEETTHDV
jgi:hypothetical protein